MLMTIFLVLLTIPLLCFVVTFSLMGINRITTILPDECSKPERPQRSIDEVISSFNDFLNK